MDKIAEARKAGISTFLSKPLNEKQLRTILQITLNKRSAPRIPFKLEVSYGEDETPSDYTVSVTFNASAGGLFLETESPLPLGEQLKLKLSLPEDNHALQCKGRVAWINSTTSPIRSDHPAGMGVEFLYLEEERLFQNFLQAQNLCNKCLKKRYNRNHGQRPPLTYYFYVQLKPMLLSH